MDHVECWQLDRPDAANALSRELVATLTERFGALSSGTRVVIVSGTGKTFCAGADLRERATMSLPEVRAFLDSLAALLRAIENAPAVVIAAVDGPALGGGAELALACDLRIAGPGASFAFPEVGLGIIPGAGGTQRLARLVGPGQAKRLIFTGRRIDASEAFRIGLVEEVASPDRAEVAAKGLAARLARLAPLALSAAKRAIQLGLSTPLDEGLAIERHCYETTLQSQDRLEGLAAFREKREPQFSGH